MTEGPISLEGNRVRTAPTTADNDAESQSDNSFVTDVESDNLNKDDRNESASITPSTNDGGSLMNVPRMDVDIATQEHNDNGHNSEPDVSNVIIDQEPDECRGTSKPRAAEATVNAYSRPSSKNISVGKIIKFQRQDQDIHK